MGTLEPGQVVRPYAEFEPWQVVSADPDPADPLVWVVRLKKLPNGWVHTQRMAVTDWIHGDWPLPF